MNRFKYADSTLKGMTKDELIKYVRTCEHNQDVAEEYATHQYENFKKIVKDWKPVVHAQWGGVDGDECSACGRCLSEMMDADSHFAIRFDINEIISCPFCGAKMDKEE